MKRHFLAFASFLFVFAASLLFSFPASAALPAAPTILKVNDFKSYAVSDPVISGVVAKGNDVLVYADDKLLGTAVIQSSKEAVDNFYFQVFSLAEGKHRINVVAKEKAGGAESLRSKDFELTIGALPAPTLVVPNEETVTGMRKPLIEGFTKSGTFVHLYIDGRYNGKTAIVEKENGTAHFAYSPFLDLSVGEHKMWAVSEDLRGRKSAVSRVVEFSIEERMPAPTILSGKLDKQKGQLMVSGLAKNDSLIKVFVDNKFDGEFAVKNHISGTANFRYTSKHKIYSGKHHVYAVAFDKRGKESWWSNIVYFDAYQNTVKGTKTDGKIAAPAKPQGEISEQAASESETAKPEDKKSESEAKAEPEKSDIDDYLIFAELYENDKSIRLSADQYKELKELLGRESELGLDKEKLEALKELSASESKQEADSKDREELTASGTPKEGGLINESRKKQGSLGWNAIVFIIFLAAVIAWIFWVNRELIRERREQEEKERKEKEEGK